MRYYIERVGGGHNCGTSITEIRTAVMVHEAVGGAIADFALVEAMITASAVTVLQVCAAAVTCNKQRRTYKEHESRHWSQVEMKLIKTINGPYTVYS